MIVSIQASAAHPSLVCAHWRNALAATVTQLTVGTGIRHVRDGHHRGKRADPPPSSPDSKTGNVVRLAVTG
jgi:hypothetical protein